MKGGLSTQADAGGDATNPRDAMKAVEEMREGALGARTRT